MITFKQFLSEQNSFDGTLSQSERLVLALLLAPSIKSSPGLARSVIAGDINLVAALTSLAKNFKAVNVTPSGATVNQTGNTIAIDQGIVDANSGQLTPDVQQQVSKMLSAHSLK